MREPDVTVVVGAYDAMPYLTRGLQSVVDQTIGLGALEVVAIDDGSTDGTGRELDRFASLCPETFQVVHQANSGGPSQPRNLGITMANGRYVFFLDADDFFGVEALERMVAMADRADSDIVVGRLDGFNGRAVPTKATQLTEKRVDLYNSRLTSSMSAQKLFRRSLLEKYEIRFAEDVRHGEDSLFTMEAYLRSKVISTVGDYPCYYRVRRHDGKHMSRMDGFAERFPSPTRMMALIAELVEPGPKADHLLVRPFKKVLAQFRSYRNLSQSDRDLLIGLTEPLVSGHTTPGLLNRLTVKDRLTLEFARRRDRKALTELLDPELPEPERVIDGDVKYSAYRYFRNPDYDLPDQLFRTARLRGSPVGETVVAS